MFLKVKVWGILKRYYSKSWINQNFIFDTIHLINSQQVFIIFVLSCAYSLSAPIAYNQASYNQPSYLSNRGYLTPPRAITNLNTYVPRQLIPSAPPTRSRIIRVYENNQPQRIYTVPSNFRTIAPAPTTRRPKSFANNVVNTNNNPRYAFNYGVADKRVNLSNYLFFRALMFTLNGCFCTVTR